MTISSINTNAAAIAAQQNISNANSATATEVAALSSGNRIVQASDDVAALSIGTALASQINTLNTSLTVASQGSSLLQVADGALAQVQSILQQQQSIATEAQSGSLSSTQLGFLNEEFQSLTQQIDQLANSTNFNGVNLLNGAISGNAAQATNATNQVTGITGNQSGAILTIGTNPVNGDTVTVDGVKVTFTTSALGSTAAAGKVVVGATADATAQNLAAFLNNLGAGQFANLQFVDAGAGVLKANYSGGILQGALKITSSTSNTTNITGTGSATIAATTVGNLADNPDGLTITRYSTSGPVTGNLLANGSSAATDSGGPIDVTTLDNNASFLGLFGGANIGQITGAYTGTTDEATFSLTVGGDTYTSAATGGSAAGKLTGGAADITLTFTGHDSTGAAAGGSFKLFLQGTGITTGSITSQSTLDPITAQLNQDLQNLSVNQDRTVTGNLITSSSNLVSVGGVQVGNLNGLSAQFTSGDFTQVNLSSLQIQAPTIGQTDAKITAVINGDTYVSSSGIGDQIGLNTVISLQDTSNPNNVFTITTGNSAIANSATTALDLSTQNGADAVQAALQQALGLDSAGSALTFQVGSATSDTIGVSIGSATSATLFGGQSLDVNTQADAANASTVLGTALNTVSALRASVGALEQRFTYASNAITSAAQNEGAAKSTLLDTDVASESTLFATSQVQLQAGIAVLAQANQLQQNLLKLIA